MLTVNETPFILAPLRTQPAPPAHALTVILKATFALKEGRWAIAEKQRDLAPDQPHMDEIGRSLAWASDLSPSKPCSDFFVLGTFHQPNGIAAPEGRGSIQLANLRKELMFYGAGHAVQLPGGDWARSARMPMVSVPLRWEFSYGGLSEPRNPMGRGIDKVRLPDGRETVPLPQIEPVGHSQLGPGHPHHPANFAPVPPGFRMRSRRLGTRDQHWAVFRAPLPPADYDARFHNAAPDDQQASDFARGDETMTLVNLHPRIPVLTTRLPGLCPRVGFLRRSLGDLLPEELPMKLDTVVALPDEDQLVLTWRGVIALHGATEDGEIEWLQARIEPLADPSPFAVLASAMLENWRAGQPKSPPPPKAPPLPQEPDVAAALGKARELLAKVKLPPDVEAVVATEQDPARVFDTLSTHLEAALAALQAKYPK